MPPGSFGEHLQACGFQMPPYSWHENKNEDTDG